MSLLLNVLVTVACCSNNTEVGVARTTVDSMSTGTAPISLNEIDASCGYKSDKTITTPFGIPTSETPWDAGVYVKNRGIVCTGTLLSKRVVITDAQSFYHRTTVLPASRYAVAVGNIDTDMDKMRDMDSQTSDVEQLIFHPEFTGESTQYRNNLALVVAAKEFSYTESVRPACISFDSSFDAEMLRRAAEDKVKLLTWDSCIRALSVDYVSNAKCRRYHTDYFNDDMFCAKGFGEGWQCVAGDGAGLVFPARVGGEDRYFLRGVAAEFTVHGYTITRFTHILPYKHFIKSVLDTK